MDRGVVLALPTEITYLHYRTEATDIREVVNSPLKFKIVKNVQLAFMKKCSLVCSSLRLKQDGGPVTEGGVITFEQKSTRTRRICRSLAGNGSVRHCSVGWLPLGHPTRTCSPTDGSARNLCRAQPPPVISLRSRDALALRIIPSDTAQRGHTCRGLIGRYPTSD